MTSHADPVGALVVLVQSIRPTWDTRAIRPVLAKLVADGHDLADVAWAAVRTAQDQAMRRPAAIGLTDSPHWRPTVRDRESADQRARRIQAQLDAREDALRNRPQRTPAQQRALRERTHHLRNTARLQRMDAE